MYRKTNNRHSIFLLLGLVASFCFFPCYGEIPPAQNAPKQLERFGHHLEKMRILLSDHPLAVIATVASLHSAPTTSLIAFAHNDELMLYFMTFSDSRKYANLQSNNAVSLVIGFGFTTMQYEGIAYELKGDECAEALLAFSRKETPCTPDFLTDPRARFFKVIPTWVRYSDYTICPADIFEGY